MGRKKLVAKLRQMEIMHQSLRTTQNQFSINIIMIGHNVKRKKYLFAIKRLSHIKQIGRKIKL